MTVVDSGDSAGISSSSSGGAKNMTSPWAQVFRGETATSTTESSIEAGTQSPSPEESGTEGLEGSNGNAGEPKKKPAWNKPVVAAANVEAVEGICCVMGLPSWPDLSECTKPVPKLRVFESSWSNAPSDGSMEPVTARSAHEQAKGDRKSNSNKNSNGHQARHRSKHGTGGGGSKGGSNGSSGAVQSEGKSRGDSNGVGNSQDKIFPHPSPLLPAPPPFPVYPVAPNGYPGMVPPMLDQFPYRGNTWEPRPIGGVMPPPYTNGNGNPYGRGGFRPRGDGPHKNNFGGRRHQDRGHYGNGRGQARGVFRPSLVNGGTFIPHQPMVPYMNPMPYHGPGMVYVPMPLIPPAQAPLMASPFLPAMLVGQIEYYFSDANLITDGYLKSVMDDQGWVPISEIAGFKRVKGMTTDTQLILDSLRASNAIEIQGDKIRKRNNWERWVASRSLPDSGLHSNASNFSESSQSEDREDEV